MELSVAIKFHFNEERQDPEDILNILTDYVRIYKKIGLLSLKAIGEDVQPEFKLISLENGSAIAWIKCIKEKYDSLVYDSAISLADSLEKDPNIDKVEKLEFVTNALIEAVENQDVADHVLKVEPYFDQKMLANIVDDLSSLDMKLQKGECAYLGRGTPGYSENTELTKITRNIIITDNVVELVSKKISHHKTKGKYYVNVPVNKGSNVWWIEDTTSGVKFSARVVDEEWLSNYQSGILGAIGPKDTIEAIIEFDLVINQNVKAAKPSYKNVKIIEVFDIYRNHGDQSDFFEPQ